MAVFNMRKITKPLLVAMAVLLLIAGTMKIVACGREYWTAKVDRTNALQVVKPIVNEAAAPVMIADFFVEYRLERDRLRSEQSEVLREVIRSEKNEEARQKAQNIVLKMVVDKQQEAEMESLIKARGFSDALVFIREGAVNVVIKSQTLNRDEVVQVADIVSRVAKIRSEDITISAKP